jgi:hypothetical protein
MDRSTADMDRSESGPYLTEVIFPVPVTRYP